MLYLCCTKLGVTLVNPLFIGYYRDIYDKPMLAVRASFFIKFICLLFNEFVGIDPLFCLSFYKIGPIRVI
jgi:hypothetical protein